MYKFGIITNHQKDPELKLTQKLIKILENYGVSYALDEKTAKRIENADVIDMSSTDVLFVLGGDGTMLFAAGLAAGTQAKICGINLGRIGFLTDNEVCDMSSAVERILSGNFRVERRMMLKASIKGRDNSFFALNEATLTQFLAVKMLRAEVLVNGNTVFDVYCDGIIVSTPTGSTGYSLSAGGPVLVPTLDNIVITPICVHGSNKGHSVVINGDDVVEVRPLLDRPCMLSLDGNSKDTVEPGGSVIISKAEFTANFIKFEDYDFFSVLTGKLAEWN